MKISRHWAMPSKDTFTIKPIAELLGRYVGDGKNWFDPFSGFNSPAELTNDICKQKPTKYHMSAVEFCKVLFGDFAGCLFDPPYSLRQLQECYKNQGLAVSKEEGTRFPHEIKNLAAKLISPGGFAISCGWNSNGFGQKRGFEKVEILIVSHGGNHNDTIVTVEKRLK